MMIMNMKAVYFAKKLPSTLLNKTNKGKQSVKKHCPTHTSDSSHKALATKRYVLCHTQNSLQFFNI